MSKRTRRTPAPPKRPCDDCEKPYPEADLVYIWPLGRLCPACRKSAAEWEHLPERQRRRARQ